MSVTLSNPIKPAMNSVMIFITVMLMDLLVGMEFDLFVPSFPELQRQFHLSPFWVETLLSANFLGYCVSLFFVGGLADRYGRKPMIVLGLTLFILGSILCLGIPNYVALVFGRFLQGIGIAAPAILSFLIIADTYPLKKQQFLMAMLNGSMNTAVAVAPVIGSYISLYFHWQGNFIALLGIGVAVLMMTREFIPKYQLPDTKQPLSLRGYLPLFQSRPLILLIITIVLMCVPYWIFVGMSPLLYMQGLGVSLAHFGYYQGALALVFALGSVLFGLILKWFQQKKLLYVANYIFLFSGLCIAFMIYVDSATPLMITLAFIPFIIGQIIPSTLLFPLSLSLMPQAKGRVSAVIQGGRLIITAVSLQIAGYCYQGNFVAIGVLILGFIVLIVVALFWVIYTYERYIHVI